MRKREHKSSKMFAGMFGPHDDDELVDPSIPSSAIAYDTKQNSLILYNGCLLFTETFWFNENKMKKLEIVQNC